MDKDKINTLIEMLLAVENYAKDIHYNCSGANFYGDHLFADRIGEGLNDYIDQLKEVCLLGHGIKTLPSGEYLVRASEYIPLDINFENMRELLLKTLAHIETVGTDTISKGDDNLISSIAQDIQNNIGLINVMLGRLA